jgi:hypothetical protein
MENKIIIKNLGKEKEKKIMEQSTLHPRNDSAAPTSTAGSHAGTSLGPTAAHRGFSMSAHRPPHALVACSGAGSSLSPPLPRAACFGKGISPGIPWSPHASARGSVTTCGSTENERKRGKQGSNRAVQSDKVWVGLAHVCRSAVGVESTGSSKSRGQQ